MLLQFVKKSFRPNKQLDNSDLKRCQFQSFSRTFFPANKIMSSKFFCLVSNFKLSQRDRQMFKLS